MNSAIEVRLLSSADASVLERVDEGVFDSPVRQEWVAAFFSNPANLLAVARADETVIGMASGIVYVHPDKAQQLFINEVGVSARFHRLGIGRRLVTTLLQRGKSLGCTEAWVATEARNSRARALYRVLGAREDEEHLVFCTFPMGS